MKLFCLSLVMIILMGGLFGPKFEEEETGPFAVIYWRDKDKGIRFKSTAEVEEFSKQLDRKIEDYVMINPQRPGWIKQNLLAGHTTIEMTKEEILLLLEEPAKKIPVSEYGADEKWIYVIYHPYGEDHLYFKGDTVIKILGFQTGNVL